MTKKLISAALFGTAILVMSGCGSSEKAPEKGTTEAGKTAEVTEVKLDADEYMELGEYKGLTVTMEPVKVSEKEVKEQLELLAEDYADYKEITDRDTVQKGDFVNMDYTCTIDGKKNEDYSESDIDTQIGDGEYSIEDVYDLDAELTGAKVGDTVTIQYTFPSDYDDDTVAGKECKMEVTINSIQEEVIPEITDAFIKENTECDTVEEYKEQTRKELEDAYASEAEQTVQDDLWEQVMDNCKQKKAFPEDIVQQEIENQTIENEEWADYFGMNVEEFIKEYYGATVEEYAQQSLKQRCVQDLLVKAEGITVSDEDYKKEIQTFIDDYGYEDEAEVMEYYTEDEIKEDIVYNKMLKALMSYANVVEGEESAQAE